jgi:hypothetical protein
VRLHLRGVPWARIGEQVGQRNLAVTANTYTHVLTDDTELNYHELVALAASRAFRRATQRATAGRAAVPASTAAATTAAVTAAPAAVTAAVPSAAVVAAAAVVASAAVVAATAAVVASAAVMGSEAVGAADWNPAFESAFPAGKLGLKFALELLALTGRVLPCVTLLAAPTPLSSKLFEHAVDADSGGHDGSSLSVGSACAIPLRGRLSSECCAVVHSSDT